MMSEVYEVGGKSPEVDERYSEIAPVPLYSQTV